MGDASASRERGLVGVDARPIFSGADPDSVDKVLRHYRHKLLGRATLFLCVLLVASGVYLGADRTAEIGHAIRHVALAAMSVLAGWYGPIIGVLLSLALLLLWNVFLNSDSERGPGASALETERQAPPHAPPLPKGRLAQAWRAAWGRVLAAARTLRNDPQYLIRHELTGAGLGNFHRVMGNVEAYVGLVAWGFAAVPNVAAQAAFVGGTILLPVVGDRIVLEFAASRIQSYGDVLWLRRPLISFVTVLSCVGALLAGASSDRDLLYLVLGIIVVQFIRFSTWLRWFFKTWKREHCARETEDRRRKSWRFNVYADPALFVVTCLLVAAVPTCLFRDDKRAATEDDALREQMDTVECPSPLGAAVCPTPSEWPGNQGGVSIFLVSDSQFHELEGERTGTHAYVVETWVPVAVRPVLLDLLSEYTLRSFGEKYRRAADIYGRDGRRLLWAYLGDAADLGCVSELELFADVVSSSFGTDRLAGYAIGNHDLYFTGNFHWHPDWEHACGRSKPARKTDPHAYDIIEGLFRHQTPAHGQPSTPRPNGELIARSSTKDDGFFSVISNLGELGGRNVLGVFLDTSDYGVLRLGIAGVSGSISEAQASWVSARLANDPTAYVVLFMHHPVAEVAAWAPEFDSLATSFGENLLAIVSAHTHLSARREKTIGTRKVPEFIVGSTTDSPQEAAILDLSLENGDPVLVFTTIPSVASKDCAVFEDEAVTLEACKDVLNEMAGVEPCFRLFDRGARTASGATPPELRQMDIAEAERIVACVGENSSPPEATTDSKVPLEKVCLSWAASVLQEHKHEGWSIGDAVRSAFDPETTHRPIRFTCTAGECR